MRLENSQNGSSKFWQVEVKGTDCEVNYGKIGTDGRSQVKRFDSVAEAQAYADTKVKEKLRGGYEVKDGFDGTSSAAPVLSGIATAAPGPRTSVLDIQMTPVAATGQDLTEGVDTDVSDDSDTSKLTLAAFKAMTRNEKERVLINDSELDVSELDIDELTDGAKLLGKSAVDDALSWLDELVETEVAAMDEEPDDMGAPSLSSVEALKSGDEILGYKLILTIDVDDHLSVFSEHYIDTEGELLNSGSY